MIRPYCFSLPAPARISLLQSWTNVLGTVLQYSYFLLFLGSLLKQCSVFEIFLQFSLPPPYTKLKLGKKFWIHASNIVCGVREGVGPVWIGKHPEMQKCPKTFVHGCLKKRWEEKRQFWGVFKPVKVFFRDPDRVRVFRLKKTDLNIITRYIKVYQRFWSRSKNLETCIIWTHKLEARFYCSHQGRDPLNQTSDRSDREKRTTSKGGPVFSKLFRLDRTDPLSFGPKFPEILVEWIAPAVSLYQPA